MYDAIIIGGGPAGLQAALSLGRARRKVLLCDAGPRRNTAAATINNFVTRDKTPPDEFRRVAREQLSIYQTVSFLQKQIREITGQSGDFTVQAEDETLHARRILLCVGMIDELPALEGCKELWGHSIFQCPYCHGWEMQDKRFAVFTANPHMAEIAFVLHAWTSDVMLFTNGDNSLPEELTERLSKANIRVEERPVARLIGEGKHLRAIELADGTQIEREAMIMRPAQRQTPLVASLNLTLDAMGFVQVNEMKQTSIPGIYAAGDLTTMMQGAILAAAMGAQAAAVLNHSLFSGQP